MTDRSSQYRGIVPYLFYDDAVAAIDWLERAFGFEARGRWHNDEGQVVNAELKVGDTEVWIDGGGRPANGKPTWVGVWVDDVDEIYRQVQAAGVEAPEPVTRDFGIQMLTVTDPEGTMWGFMKRVDPTDAGAS